MVVCEAHGEGGIGDFWEDWDCGVDVERLGCAPLTGFGEGLVSVESAGLESVGSIAQSECLRRDRY